MDPILAPLAEMPLCGTKWTMLDFVETELSNLEDSTDDELVEFFVDHGLTEEQARRALTYRCLYLTHLFDLALTPIRVGRSKARCFNPHRGDYEPLQGSTLFSPVDPKPETPGDI